MSGEKYPAKLVEKVARAICSASGDYPDRDYSQNANGSIGPAPDGYRAWHSHCGSATLVLDAIPYAAMREALELVVATAHGAGVEHWAACESARAALRAADGEET